MRLQPTATAVPPYLLRPSSFLKAKAGSNLPMLLCLKREDFSLGTRLLLEPAQIGKCQRSEIKAEAPVTARPHSGLEGGGNLPRVTQTEHYPVEGQPGYQLPSPVQHGPPHKPAAQEAPHLLQSFWEYSQFTLEYRNRNASENGARGPSHHTFPFWGFSSCVPLPWATQTQSHGVLTAVALTVPPALHFTGARQWGWLSNWESPRDRLGVQTLEAERPGSNPAPATS